MNRVDRLMNILWMIQSQKFVTLEKIAKKHNLSSRTIYRDIRALNEIGIPIYFEADRGYVIMDGYFLPPLLFTIEEANALLLLQSLAKKYSDKSIAKNADSALNKIQSVLNYRDLEKLEDISKKMIVYAPESSQSSKGYLSFAQLAITEKIIIEIKYTDSSKKRSQRKIEPIGLIFYTNQWHLIAWCWLRNDYRDFKVNQISDLKLTQEAFKKRHSYTIEDYIKIF